MKKNICLFFLLSFPLQAQEFYENKFIILWNGFLVGHAFFGKYGIVEFNSEKCYIIQSRAYNLPFLQKLYPVKDKVFTYWSIEKKIPYYSEKEIHEGNYYRFQKTYFFYDLKEIHWFQKERTKKGIRNKKGVVFLQNQNQILQDILSAVFYLKESSHKPKENIFFTIPLFDDTELTFLEIKILNKEFIKFRINNQDVMKEAWIVKPYYKTSGLFRLAGDLTIWIENEEKEILKIKAKIPYLGYVESILIEKKFF